MIVSYILDIKKVVSYPESNEVGIKIKTLSHSFMVRIKECLLLDVGDKIEFKLVDFEHSPEMFATTLRKII